MRRDFETLRRRRLDAADFFALGLSDGEIGGRLNVSRQTVGRWRRIYASRGKDALAKLESAGRKPLLTLNDEAHLRELLGSFPTGGPPSKRAWNARRLGRLIEKRFGVRYHLGHAWKLLQRLAQPGKACGAGRTQSSDSNPPGRAVEQAARQVLEIAELAPRQEERAAGRGVEDSIAVDQRNDQMLALGYPHIR